jgi:hypothetical protein
MVEIENFLLITARWTCGWFNKSKFHIILHLPSHIRRMGPAILFATEAFESFNAVIRAKSVHSNRQAPSRDIALGFAQGNRIRHILSGGFFFPHQEAPATSESSDELPKIPESWLPAGPSKAGPGPMHLINPDYGPNTATEYLGLSTRHVISPGISINKHFFMQLYH